MWKRAVSACKDLQPPGRRAEAEARAAVGGLRFAQCVRDNGVKDFPDPANGEPLVDTNKIPSSNQPGGMTISTPRCRSAATSARGSWGAKGEAEDLGAGRSGRAGRGRSAAWSLSGCRAPAAAAQEPAANTAKVERGELSAMVSQDGTLTYRARSDGSPYSVINQARGVYTELPDDRRQGRLRRRALPGGRQAGAAAVRHGPGLPRPARGRCGPRRPPAQPQPAPARLRGRPRPYRPATSSRRRRRRSRRSSAARAST